MQKETDCVTDHLDNESLTHISSSEPISPNLVHIYGYGKKRLPVAVNSLVKEPELTTPTQKVEENTINIKFDSNKLSIKPFSLDMIYKAFHIALIGKRGTGKSILIKDVCHDLFKKKICDEFVIFSPTDRVNPFYSDFCSKVYHEYDTNVLAQLLKRQQENKKNVMLVLDDCIASKGKWMNDENLKEIIYNGRHWGISYIFSMQFPLGISPEMRGNFDYVFLLREDMMSNMKRIYDQYAGMFPTFDSFRQVYGQLTKDFGSMVITNRGARSSLLEKIFFFEAQITKEKFMLPTPDLCVNDFSKFNLDALLNRRFILTIIGKRGSGKSWMVRDICRTLSKNADTEFVVFSPTEKKNEFYSKFINKVYYEYDTAILEKIINLQRKRQNENIQKNITIILDDSIVHGGNLLRDSSLRELFFNGRCYNISVILTMQFPIGITPELRANIDYVFLLGEDLISNLKRLYDHYAGMIPTFNDFRLRHSKLTENFGAMVINNVPSSRGITSFKTSETNEVFELSALEITSNEKCPELEFLFSNDEDNNDNYKCYKKILFSDNEDNNDNYKCHKKVLLDDSDSDSVVSIGSDDSLQNYLKKKLPKKNQTRFGIVKKLVECNKSILTMLQNDVSSDKLDIIEKIIESNDLIITMIKQQK